MVVVKPTAPLLVILQLRKDLDAVVARPGYTCYTAVLPECARLPSAVVPTDFVQADEEQDEHEPEGHQAA